MRGQPGIHHDQPSSGLHQVEVHELVTDAVHTGGDLHRHMGHVSSRWVTGEYTAMDPTFHFYPPTPLLALRDPPATSPFGAPVLPKQWMPR
ncbi:hypothetical protein GCM10009642_65770 [Nocardiopsis metallicus]|uniref:Uncharacterized protein n=1 Tax=Nocardiopsis metallicus TaxID=179819 RepID=A0A840W0X2_9ACTN|nr:hypothetical protein [Nocardiopsis metallicus]